MDAPDTVTDAVRLLERDGYRSDFSVTDSAVQCHTCGAANTSTRLRILRRYRFEGPSDPADEAIVLGVECAECNTIGIVVSAYGPLADADLLALVQRLPQVVGRRCTP